MSGDAGFLPSSVVCNIGILGATLGFSGWVSCFHSNLHIIFGVCFENLQDVSFPHKPLVT